MFDRLDPKNPPADDLSAYEGPFGWVKAIEGVKDFLVKAKAQYLDDLLIQSVVDNFTAKSEILDAWDWEGLVVVSWPMLPLFPPSYPGRKSYIISISSSAMFNYTVQLSDSLNEAFRLTFPSDEYSISYPETLRTPKIV